MAEKFKWEFVFTDASFDTIITACKVGKASNVSVDAESGYDLDIDDLLRIFENKRG